VPVGAENLVRVCVLQVPANSWWPPHRRHDAPSCFRDCPTRARKCDRHRTAATDNRHRHIEKLTPRHQRASRHDRPRLTSPCGRPSRRSERSTTNARMCRSKGYQRFRTHTARHENHGLQPVPMWSPVILVARWVLVCHGTPRHTAARHGTRTGGVADEMIQTDTESIDLIAEQRTLKSASSRFKSLAAHPYRPGHSR
jgi:hypothetical protein